MYSDGNKDKGEELSEKEGDQDNLDKLLDSKNIDVDRMLSEGRTYFCVDCMCDGQATVTFHGELSLSAAFGHGYIFNFLSGYFLLF